MQKSILLLLTICSSMLLAFAGHPYSKEISLSPIETVQYKNDSSRTEYKIENKTVTKEKFNASLAELKVVSGTWFCDETSTGGITGYDAKDKKGKVYEVRFFYDAGNSKSTISSKAGLN